MISKKLTITNPTGLHLRPAGMFCKTALDFECKVTFRHNNTEGNVMRDAGGSRHLFWQNMEAYIEGKWGKKGFHYHIYVL